MDILVENKDKIASDQKGSKRTVPEEIESYFDRLFPINRSLTGMGNRQTLEILSEIVQLKIHEVPSGTKCFDWTIPPEWNVKEAWIKDSRGEKIVDFKSTNLHLMGYSEPFEGKLRLSELTPHLYTLPDYPEVIPYKTSYYKRQWGFCLTHKQFLALKDDLYDIKIDAEFNSEGSMIYGEAFIKGRSEKEILFSTYICHPALANNELSGPLVTAFIYKNLAGKDLNFSYRFLFIPETIGSIFYLSRFGDSLKKNLIAGFVVTTIGDSGAFTYKRSRQGNTLADRAAELVLKQTEDDFIIEDFFPYGSDERQYCSPGFNLPVGSLMRTRYGKYWQYHTSADNKSFISFEAMEKSVQKYLDIVELIEENKTYLNKSPFCEPKLSSRGIQFSSEADLNAALWLLNLTDGDHDLIDISNRSNLNYRKLISIAHLLKEKDLIL
jgi:aminopeptidase-like protein